MKSLKIFMLIILTAFCLVSFNACGENVDFPVLEQIVIDVNVNLKMYKKGG